jgi:hypothetical protein
LLLIDFKVFSATIAPLFVRMLDMSASPFHGGALCAVSSMAIPAGEIVVLTGGQVRPDNPFRM